MSIEPAMERKFIPLVTVQKGNTNYDAVPIHHGNLDNLIGRLMSMFELNGDVEQRNAQKQAAKSICRDWLDSEYEDVCGYRKWDGEMPGGQVVRLEQYTIEHSTTNKA